jgi:hypothetical protein
MKNACRQLVSYIAPGAPATRRPARGDEPFLRPEIGFTPAWYRQGLDIDFGEKFHSDPAYRRECAVKMRAELKRRFAGTSIGGCRAPDAPLDLLTGAFGACAIAAIYGLPVVYSENNWPNCAHSYLTDEQVARLEPPDLDRNPFFGRLMEQVDWIAAHEGRAEGFINWQGILNNAHRLRGEELFADLLTEPDRCRHLFACVCETMTAAIRLLHERQGMSVQSRFVTVSNCLVNMISPEIYAGLIFPFDLKLAEVYGCIGVHNCAWNATPYLETYARMPGLGYIDMGINSDLGQARRLFPDARRALMYTPMDLASRTSAELRADFEKIARDYAPCDVVITDIEAGTPDARVLEAVDICRQLSKN